MPLILRKNVAGAEIYLWQLTETESELTALVRAEDAVSAESFTSAARRRERLAWRAALRASGIDAEVGYSAEGAPFIVGSGKCLSVSHCAGMACVALSDSRCGVDVEAANRDCSRVSSRFMTAGERSLMGGKSDSGVVVWCAKEALYKYAGRRGLDFLADMRIIGRSKSGLRAVVAGEKVTVHIVRELGYVVAVAKG